MNKINISLADLFQNLPAARGSGDQPGIIDNTGFLEILQQLISPQRPLPSSLPPSTNLSLANTVTTSCGKKTVDLTNLELPQDVERDLSEDEELPEIDQTLASLVGTVFLQVENVQPFLPDSDVAMSVEASTVPTVAMPISIPVILPETEIETSVQTSPEQIDLFKHVDATQQVDLPDQLVAINEQITIPEPITNVIENELLLEDPQPPVLEESQAIEPSRFSSVPKVQEPPEPPEPPDVQEVQEVQEGVSLVSSLPLGRQQVQQPVVQHFDNQMSIPPSLEAQGELPIDIQVVQNPSPQITPLQGGDLEPIINQFIIDDNQTDIVQDIAEMEPGLEPLQEEQSQITVAEQSKNQHHFLNSEQEHEQDFNSKPLEVEKSSGQGYGLSQVVYDPTTNPVLLDRETGVPADFVATPDLEHIYEQIVEGIDFDVNQDIQEIRINLKPEHLGEVRIKLTTEHGMINAEFLIGNQAVREVIAQSIPQLRSQLQSLGLNLGQVNVDLGHNQEKRQEHFNRQQFNAKFGRVPTKQAQVFSNPVMLDNQSQINLRI